MTIEQKYFSKKTNGEIVASIISDVVTGKISKDELNLVISLLRDKGFFENAKSFIKSDSSNWDEKYLNNLRFKVDCLSPEYFEHLYSVAKTVRERKKLHNKAVMQFRLIVLGCFILSIFIIASGIRSCTKKKQKKTETTVLSQMVSSTDISDSEEIIKERENYGSD